MDFSLSDEQAMLKNSVDRFVTDAHGPEQARRNSASEEGFSRSDWNSFAELGWLMLNLPEELGGLGGSAADAAILLEGFGRGLVAAPYISTAVISARLLAASTGFAEREAMLGRIVSGEALVALATEEPGSRYDLTKVSAAVRPSAGDAYSLDGVKIVVPDGASADHFLVSARLDGAVALVLVDAHAEGLSVRRYRTLDGRRACDLSMHRVPARLLIPDAATALEQIVDEASVLIAAEAVGCMDAAISLTADYLKTRQQFGRSLSKFQVLTHRIAEMFVRYENARSMIFRGLSALKIDSTERAAAVSATMITIIEASEFVCGQAIQLHGGIGMAEESAIGHYYKRIRAIARTYGDLSYHRQRHIALTRRRAA